MILQTIEVTGGALLAFVLPRLSRRGLAFGVYVGESRSEESEQRLRRIARDFDLGVVIAAAIGIALAAVIEDPFLSHSIPVGVTMILALGANYFVAHGRTRPLGVEASPVRSASISPSPPPLRSPKITLVFSLAIAAMSFIHAAMHADAIEGPVPTHFAWDGTPDAFSEKSFFSIYGLAVAAVGTAIGLWLATEFAARAKRSTRESDISVDAQNRFRRAIANMLAGLTILTTALLATISYGAIEIGVGAADRLPVAWVVTETVAVTLYPIVAVVWIAVKYGQGGSKLERESDSLPLRSSLADNSRWKLGVVYYCPSDPALMVEHRFGLGYTLNLGNPRAIVLLVVILLLATGVPLLGALLAG